MVTEKTEFYSCKDLIAQSAVSVSFMSMMIKGLKEIPEQSIDSFYKQYCEKANIVNMAGKNVLFTPGILVGFLYIIATSLIKHTLKNQHKLSVSKFLEKYGIKCNITHQTKEIIYMFDFIIHIRNFIAHMEFTVSKIFNFCLNDIKPKTKELKFSCNLDFDNFNKLLDALIFEYAGYL